MEYTLEVEEDVFGVVKPVSTDWKTNFEEINLNEPDLYSKR
jgi:hypothetical protein